MEIKMCRFQRSDCSEWLQFVLEAALTQARLCEVQSRWKPGERIQEPQDETWWLSEHHLICVITLLPRSRSRNGTLKCFLCSGLSREGEEPMTCQSWWDFHSFGVGMKLEALSTQGNAAHTGETLLLPQILSHHGFSGAHIVPNLGYIWKSKRAPLLPLKTVITHMVHAFHYNIHTLKTLMSAVHAQSCKT